MWNIWIMYGRRQEKNYCREQGQLVTHRQWKKQQQNIESIKNLHSTAKREAKK